ncbi:transcriptional regulatory [Fusarium mexicanum]|uniref:Transcriptional regulatory n=1 Tax=Fusarium mexicanum TaxID=751941 RepID=A0A8H5MSM5_9HYPO|nr:transcriptional regulatory [Fusarium mexicanum]
MYRRWRTPQESYSAVYERFLADFSPEVTQKIMDHYCGSSKNLPAGCNSWEDFFGRVYAKIQVHHLQRGFHNALFAGGLEAGRDVLRYRFERRLDCVAEKIPAEWGVTHLTDIPVWLWECGYTNGLSIREKEWLKDWNEGFAAFVRGNEVNWGTRRPKDIRRWRSDGETDVWEDTLWEQGVEFWKLVNSDPQSREGSLASPTNPAAPRLFPFPSPNPTFCILALACDARTVQETVRPGAGSIRDGSTNKQEKTYWFGICDGQRPSCSSCLTLGFDWLYEPGDSATNVIVRKDYVSDLEQRVSSVEHNLQRLNDVLKGHLSPCTNTNTSPCHHGNINAGHSIPSPAPTAPTKASVPSGAGTGTCATSLEEPQDEEGTPNGMAMTVVEEKTSAFYGEASNINFTQLLLRAIAVAYHSPGAPSGLDRASVLGESVVASVSQTKDSLGGSATPLDSLPTALPSVEEMDTLLDLYFDTAGVVFPFIHEETMRKTYNECRLNGFTRARRTWLGTLNMVFAMASNFDRDYTTSSKKRFERSNAFYKRALGLCNELSKRVISLEIVHYLILVVLHCQGTSRSMQTWNNYGLVIRSAMALGLHSESTESSLDPVQKEYRRRTWVVIYCLDKVLSTAVGRPASIPDDQMTRREPASGWSPANSGDVADLPGDFLAVSFKMYQVTSKSLAIQYGANLHHDLEPDEMAHLKASSELRKQLRLWAANLPLHL